MRMKISAALLILAAGCGGEPSETAPADQTPESNGVQSDQPAKKTQPETAAKKKPPAPAAHAADAGDFADRTGEITNPDNAAMVFLYYDLAGLPVPVDKWVEEDGKVKFAPPIEKAANREQVRAAIEAGADAVDGIGLIRLTMNANLSEYDPAFGEFTVRALAPSSYVGFNAFGQNVSLKFANAQTAQIWSVPEAEAQAVRDRIQYVGAVSMDVLAKVRRVQPSSQGGTIIADVLEYELRNSNSGTTIGRVKVDG